jgi:hypothetical protein
MNTQLVLGTALNLALAAVVKLTGEYSWLGTVLLAFGLVVVLGLGLVAAGQRKAGAYVVLVGSIAFVPLGIVAIFGARKLLDELGQEQFQAKRTRRS